MIAEASIERAFKGFLGEALTQAAMGATGFNTELLRYLYVLVRLVKRGYSVSTAMKAFRKHWKSQKGNDNDRELDIYVKKLTAQLNDELLKDSKRDPQAASKELEEYIRLNKLKYKYDEGKGLGVHQKGKIILSMLAVGGFAPELVEAAMLKNAEFGKDEADNHKLVEQCLGAMGKYQNINDIKLESRVSNLQEIYWQYAKEHMQTTGTKLLGERDDQKILSNMFGEMSASYKKQLPDTPEGRASLEKAIGSLKQYCFEAVKDGSPVVEEPGRDKSQYLNAVMEGAKEIYDRDSNQEYLNAQTMYNDMAVAFDKNRSRYMELNPEHLIDVTYAKNGMDQMQDESLITQAILRNSRYRNSMQCQPDEYAKQIISGAKRSQHFERLISYDTTIKPIPQDAESYNQLVNEGVSAKDLYVNALRERMEMYPNFRNHLSDDYADRDAAVKLLAKYDDMDVEALKNTIREFSPRAALPGMPFDYADLVVEQAQKEMQEVKSRENWMKNIQKEYRKSCVLAMAGIPKEDNPLMTYTDGQIAMQMMMNKVPSDDVHRLIEANAELDALGIKPMTYTNGVVSAAELAIDRTKAIENYTPRRFDDVKDLSDYYMEEAHKLEKAKGFPDASMDVNIFKKLSLMGAYEDDKIQKVIQDRSPLAIEPGRDAEGYSAYVRGTAEQEINAERLKLSLYQVIPRTDHKETADEEYEYHRQKIADYVDLPFCPEMDKKIANGMVQQNFEADAVSKAIDKLSPVNEKEDGYGRGIVTGIMSVVSAMTERIETKETEDVKAEPAKKDSQNEHMAQMMALNQARVRTRQTYDSEDES